MMPQDVCFPQFRYFYSYEKLFLHTQNGHAEKLVEIGSDVLIFSIISRNATLERVQYQGGF